MEMLSKMFGGNARVKMMRLFLLNQDTYFEPKEIASRSKVSSSLVRKELNNLSSFGFIKKKAIPSKTKTKKKISKKKKRGQVASSPKKFSYFFDSSFPYTDALTSILVEKDTVSKGDMATRFRRAGKIKALVVSGIFIKEKDSRVDILVVGDGIKRPVIDRIVKDFEAELGKELSYAVFETQEFVYRLSMRDKLVSDILDYPHERVVDQIGLSTRDI